MVIVYTTDYDSNKKIQFSWDDKLNVKVKQCITLTFQKKMEHE